MMDGVLNLLMATYSYLVKGGTLMIFIVLCSIWMWALIICHLFNRKGHSSDRDLSTICTLSEVAPLLGLLGTITGMIAAFRVISGNMSVGGKDLADAISEALITTQTGLAVAVPGILVGHLSSSQFRIRRRRSEKDE